VVGVFLDLRKAFDVVPHYILLKFSKLGINGMALDWFRSYVEGRKQKVEINGALSEIAFTVVSIL
jgi:hypothetical protein